MHWRKKKPHYRFKPPHTHTQTHTKCSWSLLVAWDVSYLFRSVYVFFKIKNTYSSGPASWGIHSHSWSSHSESEEKSGKKAWKWEVNNVAGKNKKNKYKAAAQALWYLLRFFEVTDGCLGLSIVEIKCIVVVEVTLKWKANLDQRLYFMLLWIVTFLTLACYIFLV